MATTDAYTTGLLSKELPTELTRLRLLEECYDPGTIRIIAGLGVKPAWHCLELGAGAGSIAYWLADHVPGGSVLAADIDTRYLDSGRSENLTVRQLDVTKEGFPAGSFDLVHARAVFMHLNRREEILRQAMSWLRPGGWLVVEDVYFLPAADSPYPSWQRASAAWHAALAAQGIDLAWARRAPAMLAAAGCVSIGASVAPGGLGVDAIQDELLRIRLSQSGSRLVADHLVTAEEIKDAQQLIDDIPAPDFSTFMYSSWGQRPTAG